MKTVEHIVLSSTNTSQWTWQNAILNILSSSDMLLLYYHFLIAYYKQSILNANKFIRIE